MTSPSATISQQTPNEQEAAFFTRPLRIAMFSIHASPLGELGTTDTGGMSVYIRELSQELGRAGHRVDIYTCADNERRTGEVSLSEQVRLIHVGIGNNGRVSKGALFKYLPEVFLSIEAYVTENKVCYDLIHSHYWLSGWVGHLAQTRWYVPQVMTFHTTGMAKRLACGQEREPALRLVSERKLSHSSDRLLVTTERERDLLARYYDVPRRRIGVVPCGVNLERFRPITKEKARKELGLQGAGHVVLFVGRFVPVKGLDRLMAAIGHLRHHRGLTFVIVGGEGRPTNSSADLRRLARKASVEGIVRFQGRVEHDLLPLYYSAADVLAVPSYYESFGMVALESLACGTPVIATPVGAMDTLIQNGRTGILVDSPSPRSLASAIERFIIASPDNGASREEIRASVLDCGWPDIGLAVAREYESALRGWGV